LRLGALARRLLRGTRRLSQDAAIRVITIEDACYPSPVLQESAASGNGPLDRLQQRLATTVQIFCVAVVAMLLGSTAVESLLGRSPQDLQIDILVSIAALACFLLTRRGRMETGVKLLLASILAVTVPSMISEGLVHHRSALKHITIPLTVAALLLGRRALWTTALLYGIAIVAGAAHDGSLFGPTPALRPFNSVDNAVNSAIAFVVVGIILDRFGVSLREAATASLRRQRELERANAEKAAARAAREQEEARRATAEAQLSEVVKVEALARLSGGVAHEYNNALTAIDGFARLCRAKLPGGSEVSEYLDQVVGAADRATQLTRRLLLYARETPSAPRLVRVEERVRAGLALMRRLLPSGIELQTRFGAGLGAVSIDPGQLDQVLLNLVVNARDAMPRGGLLSVEVRNTRLAISRTGVPFALPPGEYVSLFVRDTGVGMSPQVLGRIFEPFFTTKQEGKGTGLGLATCLAVVSQAGGAIFLSSELGRGTSFEILFPRAGEALAEATPFSPGPLPRGKETVLLVEDQPQVRALAARALEELGYRVLEAGAAEEALARLDDAPIQLLIADLRLPGMGGRELADRVRERQAEARVLFISGYPEASQGDGPAAGAFLDKPFTIEAFSR
jgi:signal transduction histidine kinase